MAQQLTLTAQQRLNLEGWISTRKDFSDAEKETLADIIDKLGVNEIRDEALKVVLGQTVIDVEYIKTVPDITIQLDPSELRILKKLFQDLATLTVGDLKWARGIKAQL